MKDRAGFPRWQDAPGADRLVQARDRLAESDRRVQMRLADATPPEPMAAAPVAPARGFMQMVPNYEVTRGGIRRQDGAHWQEGCALVAMNVRVAARAKARGIDDYDLPFGPGHISMAAIYRALVEWRQGSGVKCGQMEAGRGGSGSGVFIDTFMDQGARLDDLVARIGVGYAIRPTRHQDRDNARRAVPTKALVDLVVIDGRDLSYVMQHYGWQPKGVTRRALQLALCAALDRMQGWQ